MGVGECAAWLQLGGDFSVDCVQLVLDFSDLLAKVLLKAENMRVVVRDQPEVLKRLEAAFQGFKERKVNCLSSELGTLPHGKRFPAVGTYDDILGRQCTIRYILYFQSS